MSIAENSDAARPPEGEEESRGRDELPDTAGAKATPSLELAPPTIAPPHSIRARGARPSIWIGGAATLLLFVSVMAPYRETVDEVHVVLPMLLLILLASSIGGERLGFFLAAVGFVAIDTIFQRPFGTFSMRKSHDLTVLVSFFVTAAVATRLLARAQFQAAEARRRSAEVQRMADLGADMLSAANTTAALERVATVMCELLGAERCRISRGVETEKQNVVAEATIARSSGADIAAPLPIRCISRSTPTACGSATCAWTASMRACCVRHGPPPCRRWRSMPRSGSTACSWRKMPRTPTRCAKPIA